MDKQRQINERTKKNIKIQKMFGILINVFHDKYYMHCITF